MRERAKEAISILASTFRVKEADMDGIVKSFLYVLGEIKATDDEITRATKRVMLGSRFMPAPSEFVRIIHAIREADWCDRMGIEVGNENGVSVMRLVPMTEPALEAWEEPTRESIERFQLAARKVLGK